MVGTQALYRQVGKKIVSCGGVFDLAVEQPQLFRKLPKNKNKKQKTNENCPLVAVSYY